MEKILHPRLEGLSKKEKRSRIANLWALWKQTIALLEEMELSGVFTSDPEIQTAFENILAALDEAIERYGEG